MANSNKDNRENLKVRLDLGHFTPIPLDGLEVDGVSSSDKGSHLEYRFANAHLLLKALDVEAKMYRVNGGLERRAFLFRGHEDASWELLPSIFRISASAAPEEKKRHRGFVQAHHMAGHIQRELDPFYQFLEGINDLGMFIDNGSVKIMNDMRSRVRVGSKLLETKWPELDFPTQEQLSALALAQHYGLPTRLLDWTANPYVALFFAIERIRSFYDFRTEKELGIWILPRDLLDLTQFFKFLKVVEVPRFQNPNIIAQQGLFTSHIPPFAEWRDKGVQPPIDADKETYMTLNRYLTDHNNDELHQQALDVVGKPLLFKLGHNEIEPLRRKLDQLNINWRTLMPNLEGATKEAIRLSETQRVHD